MTYDCIVLHKTIKKAQDFANDYLDSNLIVLCVSPKSLNRCRGVTAEFLSNPADLALPLEDLLLLKHCFKKRRLMGIPDLEQPKWDRL